jgi:hypothetical protein
MSGMVRGEASQSTRLNRGDDVFAASVRLGAHYVYNGEKSRLYSFLGMLNLVLGHIIVFHLLVKKSKHICLLAR